MTNPLIETVNEINDVQAIMHQSYELYNIETAYLKWASEEYRKANADKAKKLANITIRHLRRLCGLKNRLSILIENSTEKEFNEYMKWIAA